MSLPPCDAPTTQDELPAGWRHMLRSPLAALMAAAAVLERAPAGSPAATEALGIITRQTRTLAWLLTERPEPPPAPRPGAP